MKIGLIVEGRGEIGALQCIVGKIESRFEIIQRPLRADLQPRCNNFKTIARSARTAVEQLRRRNAELIIVLLDAEDDVRPDVHATGLRNAFVDLFGGNFEIVLKVRKVENWLIADTQALSEMKSKFRFGDEFSRQVSPNRADNVVDAERLLKKIAIKDGYNKGSDPIRIMEKQCPYRVAENSRSFRRFLRVAGCPAYKNQSKMPAS